MTEINRVWMVRERLRITSNHKTPDEYMGRFGGGWKWCLGFDAGPGFRSVIINLLTFSVWVHRGRRREPRSRWNCQSHFEPELIHRCDREGGHPGWHEHDGGGPLFRWPQGKGYKLVSSSRAEDARLVQL